MFLNPVLERTMDAPPAYTTRAELEGLIAAVRCRVLVMHGDRDSVIPFELGRALFDSLDGPKRFVTIRGGDHNDSAPPDEAAYWSAVDAFIAGTR